MDGARGPGRSRGPGAPPHEDGPSRGHTAADRSPYCWTSPMSPRSSAVSPAGPSPGSSWTTRSGSAATVARGIPRPAAEFSLTIFAASRDGEFNVTDPALEAPSATPRRPSTKPWRPLCAHGRHSLPCRRRVRPTPAKPFHGNAADIDSPCRSFCAKYLFRRVSEFRKKFKSRRGQMTAVIDEGCRDRMKGSTHGQRCNTFHTFPGPSSPPPTAAHRRRVRRCSPPRPRSR